MIYVFGDCKLDTLNAELYRDGQLCKLEPRAFELLIYLIEHRDHVVSREELLAHLWPGQSISEGVINNGIKRARQAIGDSGEGQHKIRTLYGRGYRFVAETQERGSAEALLQAAPDAPNPGFKSSRPLAGPMSSSPLAAFVDPGASSQNVLVGDYGAVTVLCGTLDPLEMPSGVDMLVSQRLRRTFFALVQREAQRHGGVFKFFGPDGFLMLVGQPVAHPDHARRAILAGLRLQKSLHENCAALDIHPPGNVTVRMGLHTGLIEIRDLGDPIGVASLTKAVTTALAIQLLYHAKAGNFLTSKAALPYVQHLANYVEHGAIPMPGHTQRLMTYRICEMD
jgi:DNA-binding winged helix-turn-helix (wHTH) protein/class 3 adenylate cyclase